MGQSKDVLSPNMDIDTATLELKNLLAREQGVTASMAQTYVQFLEGAYRQIQGAIHLAPRIGDKGYEVMNSISRTLSDPRLEKLGINSNLRYVPYNGTGGHP